MKRYLFLVLILVGLTAILGQVVIIRELTSVFYGNELSLGIIFSSWMLWIAAGSWFAGRYSDKINKESFIFPVTFCLAAIFLPLEIILIRSLRLILQIPQGELIGFIPIIYSTFLILAPYCLLAGFQFSLGCRIYSSYFKSKPEAVGRVYIFEAVGDVIGAALFSYILVYLFGPFEIIFGISLLNLLCALILITVIGKKSKIYFSLKRELQITRKIQFFNRSILQRTLAIFIILLLILNFFILSSSLKDNIEKATLRFEWKGLSLIETANSIYGKLAVIRQNSHYSFFENGLLMFTTGVDIAAEEIVHFPMLQHPNPKEVLVIGTALGSVLKELLKYDVDGIYYLELDPKIIDFSKRYLTRQENESLEDRKVQIKYSDGRLFIKQTDKKFDVIIINLPDPHTSRLNRFYTVEFFKEAQSVLGEDGVLSFRIASNENYLGPYMRKYNSCIYHSLNEAFKNIILVPGEELTFIASKSDKFLTYNTILLNERLIARKVKTRFINQYYLSNRLYPERVKFILNKLETQKVSLNRDFYPISYYYNIVLWGSYFSPYFKSFFEKLSSISWNQVVLTLICMTFLLVLSRRKSYKWSVPFCITTTGLAGISFELILIFSYQVLYGYVYNYIGVLIAGFMVGLVLGGFFMNRRLESINDKTLALTRIELSVIIYAIILPLILFMLTKAETKNIIFLSKQFLFPLLVIIAGFLVGSEFPLANKIQFGTSRKVASTAGMLYASDLLGACFGSLVITIFIIPIYGIMKACFFVALVNMASFVLIISSRNKLNS